MIKYILGKLGFVFSESVEDKANEMIEYYENHQVVSYDSDNRYKLAAIQRTVWHLNKMQEKWFLSWCDIGSVNDYWKEYKKDLLREPVVPLDPNDVDYDCKKWEENMIKNTFSRRLYG